MELAKALLRWLNYDRCSRNLWIGALVQSLRLSPDEFAAIITSEEFVQADKTTQEALRKQVCTELTCNGNTCTDR